MLIVLLIGLLITLFAYLLIIGFAFAVPLACIFFFVVLGVVLKEFFDKKRSQAQMEKVKPIYDEQLKKLSPEARFFLDVQSVAHQPYPHTDVELREDLRNQIRAIAGKHGLDLKEQFACERIYVNGRIEIQKAQEKFILKQKDGTKMMCYLCLVNKLKDMKKPDIKGFVNFSFNDKDIGLALKKSNFQVPSREYGQISYLHDEHRILAIKTYNEGKAAYENFTKTYTGTLPVYFYRWLVDESEDLAIPEMIQYFYN